MDAKDLRTESTLSERKDGSKYSQSGAAQQCNRNKTYHDVGTNPLGKAETAAAVRPCAVIGPDRVLPPPNSNDAYLKKGSIEPWPCPDNIYSQLPDYHHKMSSNPNQIRNISPRQTFQENMQRIMVPPAYNSIKNTTDGSTFNLVQDRAPVLSKNSKPNMALEAKYCDVPYTVNQLSNEHKSFRESELSVPSVNSTLMRTIPHGWSPNSGNLHAPRTYGAHEVYQYQQYPNCVGPRPPMLPVGRRHQTFQDEAGYVYPDSYYQDPSIRYKSYPQVKERYPQPRFDYIGNYSNPYHPPPTFPPHKYDIPKPGTAHQYPMYPHLKYLDNRGSDPNIDAYQRPSNQPPPGYNMPFRNQVIHPTYPGVGNAQTKVLPYSVDSSGKPIVTNKLPYDSNKLYIDYDNARNKSYAVNDPYFLNEINRIQPAKNQIIPPNYPTANMHHVPNQQFLRKDIHMKSHEFMPHFRNFDPSVGTYTMIRHPSQFSPNTIAISPTDSNTSNDTTQTQGTNQEDCGYVSQSSSASVRSIESGVNRMSSEYYKRHDYRYGPIGNTHMHSKHEVKGKKQIDVRQFLQMWNEGDDDNGENNNKESVAQTSTSNIKQDNKEEQLYVLGLVNVPSEELSKYEHIQTVSKLPEHIKGYNSIELLKQYEEVVESSNMGSFKSPVSKNFHMPLRDNRNTPKQVVEVLPRPISPLDVEAKISQSVIHKEVGCNFEIKPCSPKMLNVEIPAPVQNVLGERAIEKVSNPRSKATESPASVQTDDDSLHNNLKRQASLPSYEKSSCKILSSSFAPHNLDSVKTDYSIQDLEINSGVCLASLPRLDNEIELNFPEVNQQFIDANKIGNNTSIHKSKLNESDTIVESNTSDSEDIEGKNITFSQDNSQKEYTRLNKYRKNNSAEHSENAVTAVRTDSVIIKNPETLKNVSNSPRNDHSNFKAEETHVPVNLTSHIDVNNRTIKASESQNDQYKTETYVAIDFSLNKNDVNRANKVSKRSKARTSKQIVNEKNKSIKNYCFGVPLSDTNAHYKHFQESNNEADIQEPAIYKKESNISLPNITSEEMENFNEYSCKADFDDVMKKLTANDFEITNEIRLDSNNIITNSNDDIENKSGFNVSEQDFKSNYDLNPASNEQFVTSSQQSTNRNNYDADILIEKVKSNQQSIENQQINGCKVEHIEAKQCQTENKNSEKGTLIEEETKVPLISTETTELKKIDIDKLTEEEQNVKVKQLVEIEDIGVNNLSEKDKLISTEFETYKIDTVTGENQVEITKPRQIENDDVNTDQLTEEKESLKIKQVVEFEKVDTNGLYEKDQVKECNTFDLDLLIKEERNLIPKQTEHPHFNTSKEEQKQMEIRNFDSNILIEDDQSLPLELDSKTKGVQSITNEKPSQEGINLDSEMLAEEGPSRKTQQSVTALQEVEMDIVNNEDHNLTSRTATLKNDSYGKDLMLVSEQATMQEQNLEKSDTTIDNNEKEILLQNELIKENSNLETKMLEDLQNVEIKIQHEDNENVKTDALSEEDQSMSEHERPHLSTKTKNLDTDLLIEPKSIDIKMQLKDNKDVKTDTISEKNQSILQNERSHLSRENSDFETEMLIDQHCVATKIPRKGNISLKTDMLTEDDHSVSQKLQLEDSSSSDAVMSIEEENMNGSHVIERSSCLEDEHSLEDCVSDNNLNENHSENITLPASSIPVDTNDSKSPLQNLEDEHSLEDSISDNNLNENENNSDNTTLPASLPIDTNESKYPLQNYVRNSDEEMKNDIDCNSGLFKPVYIYNSHYKIKMYSPQMQKLILHVEGSIKSYNNILSETILCDKTFEQNETTNEIVDEPGIDEKLNTFEIPFEAKTVTEETLEKLNSGFDILPPIDSKDGETMVETVSVVNTSKSVQDDPHFEFDKMCDSPKATIVESDSNTTDSADEQVTSLIDMKNLETSNVIEENIMVDDFTINTECEEVYAHDPSVSDCDNIRDSICMTKIESESVEIDRSLHHNNIDVISEQNDATIESESVEIDRSLHHNNIDVISEKNDTTIESESVEIDRCLHHNNIDVISEQNDTTIENESVEIDRSLHHNNVDVIYEQNDTTIESESVEINRSLHHNNIDVITEQNDTTIESESVEIDRSLHHNKIDVISEQNYTTIESESVEIDRSLHHNNIDVISEQNDTTIVTRHDQSFAMPEINEENVVYTIEKNITEVRNFDQSNDSLKLRHTSLKRSLSDSALNAFAQDNNRELNWPTKRRKIDENTFEQNIINESICRLIQASRRNSISSFDTEENVSFCILIDDSCILSEENAQDKMCYTEVTDSTENDAINQNENNITGVSFPQNDINLLTAETVIYQCQEDDAVNEDPWVEDIACIETVSCENVVEELVMDSPSPKHGYNDTVISENVAEDVVISSPSSIKYFEDDFVNVAPTFNHDWVETLVDDGVAEDVVISSFLTTKEECLGGEICTNVEETVKNSPSSLKGDWSEPMDEESSVLTHREGWNKTFVDVNDADDAVANSRFSTKCDCLEAGVKKINQENVLITSPSKNNTIEPELKEKVTRNTISSSVTHKHSHSFERVVKVSDVMITDSPSSSKDHLEYDDNELSCYNLHEHANKVKSIYGERMTDGDAQIVDTLFRTPQMDVNKTLLHDPLELDISAKLSHMEYSDDSSSESSQQKSSSCIFSGYSDSKVNDSDIVNCNTYQKENIVAENSTAHSNAFNESSDTSNTFSAKCIPQDKTVHSCESSADNVFAYEDSNYTSSSPEVSSTTSEEKNSGILLKITNLNGSRISQINEIKTDRKPRCKFTEKKEYSSNRFPNRQLITKAAQKYIPPVKESIRDLKVKISLPPQSLIKFKELKLSRSVSKVTNKQSSTNIPKIPKKTKPLFEDVLKSIDEIQIKMHREKKKPKTTVPKVVIKKNEYGSHYASTSTKEPFNPDLTGRKWQPWVFIERNNFIDKMALKNKTRAVFNHRKKCYVLTEKFKKYKSAVSNTKFVISRPSSIKSTGQLKYTIRLKHSY